MFDDIFFLQSRKSSYLFFIQKKSEESRRIESLSWKKTYKNLPTNIPHPSID